MDKHSKTPWHVGAGNGEGSVFCESGRMRLENGGTALYPVAAFAMGFDPVEDVENGRRIVACVNACEGISTDLLEEMGTGTLLRQRDSNASDREAVAAAIVAALVRSLEEVMGVLDADGEEDEDGNSYSVGVIDDEVTVRLERARRAIANAKGVD